METSGVVMATIAVFTKKCRKCGKLIVSPYMKQLENNLAKHEAYCKFDGERDF